MIRRVIKFGGSLFVVPGLQQLWRAWLQRQEPATNIVIAGGGTLVDSIRTWQCANGLDDAFCHWLSIEAMSLSAQWLHQLLVDAELTRNIDDLKSCELGTLVFDVADWIRTVNELPESWDVTSDSISAHLAQSLNAHELVLLKSSLPQSPNAGIIEWARAGFVDRHFPVAAAGLAKIRMVNLQSKNRETQLVAC